MFSLKVNGKVFDFFTEYTVNLMYNSIASTFTFTGYYDVKNPDHIRLFRPLQYQKVEIYRENELVLTGTILNTATKAEANKQLATISGYSLPGILSDCQIPYTEENYSIQFDGLSLQEITERIIKPFGLKLVINDSVLKEAQVKYESVMGKIDQPIAEFLIDLCREKNIILTHDKYGNVLFDRPRYNDKSIATYEEGKPGTQIALSVNGQAMHSSITVIRQGSIDTDSTDEATESNEYVKEETGDTEDLEIVKIGLVGKFRPKVSEQKQSNSSIQDKKEESESIPKKLAKTIISEEISNIKLTIETDRWQWWTGRKLFLLTPNHIIDVLSPENFIRHKARFFVESVSLVGKREGQTATITTVPAEAYTGDPPKNIFR